MNYDGTKEKIPQLAVRKACDPNPYVGWTVVQRHLARRQQTPLRPVLRFFIILTFFCAYSGTAHRLQSPRFENRVETRKGIRPCE